MSKQYTRATYAEYLKTEHWGVVRNRALEYAEQRCQLCNTGEKLEVHHRTYERLGRERPADVIVLCGECHRKHHDRHTKHGGIVVFRKTERVPRVTIAAARFRALMNLYRAVETFLIHDPGCPDEHDLAQVLANIDETPSEIGVLG